MFLTRSIPVRTADELAACAGPAGSSPRCTSASAPRSGPGVTTVDLDRIGREVLDRRGATSNFLGYHGYPAVICASPNDVVVHGIPSDDVVLEEGDIVSIDCGAIVDGWHGDAAFTAPVGTVAPAALALIEVADAVARRRHRRDGRRRPARRHRRRGPGRRGGAPASRSCGTTPATASAGPCTRTRRCHNTGRAGTGPRLRAGNVLAIEPMVSAGTDETVVLDDGWSVVTADGALGRPRRAHRRRHRRRPRGPDRL